MNIVIIDGYHDSDKGGAGILNGTLHLLLEIEKESDQKFDIDLVYRYSKQDPRFETAARHTAREFPMVNILGSPFDTREEGVFKKIWSLKLSFFRYLFPSISRNETIRALRKADIIVSKGGHFYQNHASRNTSFLKQALGTYNQFYTLLLALRMKKRVALISHSLGPFEGSFARRVARNTFSRVDYLSAREEITKEILIEMGLKPEKIHVLSDLAFAMKPLAGEGGAMFLKDLGLTRKRYAVVTARQWDFPLADKSKKKNHYEDYLEVLADAVDHLIDSGAVDEVALVVHNDGKHSDYEDDKPPIDFIAKHVNRKDKIKIIDSDYSAPELACIYGNARIMIGTRLHSVIFALVAGAPSIAISYTHKGAGIMASLGFADYALNIDTLQSSELTKTIDKLIENEDRLMSEATQKIAEKREHLKKELMRVIHQS